MKKINTVRTERVKYPDEPAILITYDSSRFLQLSEMTNDSDNINCGNINQHRLDSDKNENMRQRSMHPGWQTDEDNTKTQWAASLIRTGDIITASQKLQSPKVDQYEPSDANAASTQSPKKYQTVSRQSESVTNHLDSSDVVKDPMYKHLFLEEYLKGDVNASPRKFNQEHFDLSGQIPKALNKKFNDRLSKTLNGFLLKLDELIMDIDNEEKDRRCVPFNGDVQMIRKEPQIQCRDLCERLRVEILIAKEKLTNYLYTEDGLAMVGDQLHIQEIYNDLLTLKAQLLNMRRKYYETIKRFNQTLAK